MPIANVLLVAGSANFSTRDVWDGYRHSLAALGVRVVPYPTFSYLQVLSPAAVCNDIIGSACDVDQHYDCVIFVDGLYFRGQRARVPLSIRKAGITTVLIATDDPYEELPNVEALYTVRFTNELSCTKSGAVYLPTATLPLPEIPRTANPRYDVSFLGTVFEDRLPWLLEVAGHCERTGRRLLIAGKFVCGTEPFENFVCTEVRQGTIEAVEKWEIYSQSRVTLNLFRESTLPAESPSPRVFEVAAFGQAALVTGPRREEVTRIFGETVYHFDDAPSAIAAIEAALADEPARLARIQAAQEIAVAGHLYEHRAERLLQELRDDQGTRSETGELQHRVAWLVGAGRTGSTWLAEMLGDLPGLRRWHEPYFGRLVRHLQERPEDLNRQAAFFNRRHQSVWMQGLRDMFFSMVRARYPRFGRHALIVKEVNTPELCPWLRPLFPDSRVILLVRDPFDVLDSYLDLQRPGSWNPELSTGRDPLEPDNVRRTAENIIAAMRAAETAYDAFPLEQRLRVTYEELLADPVPALIACGRLVGVEGDPEAVRRVARERAFSRYSKTGPLEFRRRGEAGGWKSSENFTPQVRSVADEILGPLRARLGYTDT